MEVNSTTLLLAVLIFLPAWAAWTHRKQSPDVGCSPPGGLPSTRRRRGKRKGAKKGCHATKDHLTDEEQEEQRRNNVAKGYGNARSPPAELDDEVKNANGPRSLAVKFDECDEGKWTRKRKGTRNWKGTANDYEERGEAPNDSAWKQPLPRQMSAASGNVTVIGLGSGSGRRKPQKGPSLTDFPALSAATTPSGPPALGRPQAADRESENIGECRKEESDITDRSSRHSGPDGGIRHPNDREVEEEGGQPVRVIKLVNELCAREGEDTRGPEERRGEEVAGWVAVPKGPSGRRTLRITSSSKSTDSPRTRTVASYGPAAPEESKKQRGNRRRAERKKEEKDAERKLQDARLQAHRRELVAVRIKNLAKEDAKEKRPAVGTSQADAYNELLWE